MKTSPFLGRKSWTFAGVLLVSALLSGVAGAQAAFNFSPGGGFTSTNVCPNSAAIEGCVILTNGSPNQPTVISGGILRLNTADPNQHASAWYSTAEPLNTGFTTAFQFTIANGGGPGDGIALVIQGDPAGTGAIGYTGNGQNMSYGNNDSPNASGPGNAILNSLAVELDTYQNGGGLNVGYGDPNGNHIGIQSCAPTTNPTAPAPVLNANSADHNYVCPDGKHALLGITSLTGVSLSDGSTHTLTVNYLPPGTCTSSCNNFSVYLDSSLVLQITLDITKQLSLPNNSAYLGFTSATGAAVEDNDIVSWSYSQLPLAPITITQPLQPDATTTFNFSPTLTAKVDYSKSGIDPAAFNGVFMQSTVQVISDTDYQNLVANTPFQGTTCLHQDIGTNPSTGQPTYACVVTTDLCTTPTSATPLGTNCPGALAALIGTANIFNADPSQKPITGPGYIMGRDTALSCGSDPNPTACKNLINIFDNITGDPTVTGKTKNFNSLVIPIQGVVQPVTAVTTNPPLNQGWARGPVSVMFNATESPANNTITKIDYSAAGDNLPAPVSGTITGSTGSIAVPATGPAVQGSTVLTYAATDSSGTPERVVTNNAGQLSTALPTFAINFDLTPPVVACSPPAPAWQAPDVGVPCSASDSPSGLANPSQASFNLATAVLSGTETKTAMTSTATVFDVAGNSASTGPFGPFWVDKKRPVISAITVSPVIPILGQPVTVSYSCSDGGSGVALCGSASFAGVASTGTLISAVDGTLGTHTFTVNATDLVGNTTSTPVTYTVSAGAQLSISPTTIAFGNVKIYSINAKTITVKNTGTSVVNFSSIRLTQTESDGGPGREFVMLNLCGSKLAAGKSCTVVIGFVADEIVGAAGTVTFVDNAAGSPQQVQISGNVVQR